MILIRAALIRLLQSFAIFMLSLGTLACFLVSYSYIGGDATDREDIARTVAKAASHFRVIPPAEAATRTPSSLE